MYRSCLIFSDFCIEPSFIEEMVEVVTFLKRGLDEEARNKTWKSHTCNYKSLVWCTRKSLIREHFNSTETKRDDQLLT